MCVCARAAARVLGVLRVSTLNHADTMYDQLL